MNLYQAIQEIAHLERQIRLLQLRLDFLDGFLVVESEAEAEVTLAIEEATGGAP